MNSNTNFGDDTNPSDFTTAGKFDLNKFNAAFEQHKYDLSQKRKLEDEKTLSQLNAPKAQKPISEYNLLDILIGTKNAWFGIIDDLLEQKFIFETFTKGNRLFFVGLTLIFFATVLYLYNFFIEDEVEHKSEKVVKIEHHYIGPPPPHKSYPAETLNLSKIISED